MTEQLGRYEILEKIGYGGFAIVYRGRDTELDRLVALKELKPSLVQDSSWVERFRREARTIARLDHTYIVPIYDVYEAKHRLFIVMRLIEGSSLEETINSQQRLPWAEVVEIISKVADGLDYAHSNGVLHRDLKPANILIDSERGPLLSDFGLAKLTGEHSMSASGSVVGTPHYIAPEVWEGQPARNQSDIYALGCILYEMLTGKKIFQGETPPAVMMAHFSPLLLPRTWPAGVPPGIRDVLATALARKPDDRYAKANEMARALAALTVDDQARVDHPFIAVGPDHSVEASPRPTTDQTDGPERATTSPVGQEIGVQPALGSPREQGGSPPQSTTTEGPVLSPLQPPVQPEELWPQSAQAPQPVAHPSASPPSSPPYAPKAGTWERRRRRPGCLLASTIMIIGLALVAVISAATFCSTLTNTFNNAFPTVDAALADIFTNAFPTVEVGSTLTKELRIPVPTNSDMINLEISFGPGELVIEPGAKLELVEGMATYNTEQLKPTITTNENRIRLEPETEIGLTGFTRQDIKNRWDLKLGSSPMQLTIDVGIGEADIELGGLSLLNLNVSRTVAASNFDLSFSEPNQINMETLRFKSGASQASIRGLANARAAEIRIETGPGAYTLAFNGSLQRDVKVRIENGPGELTIVIPEGIPTQLALKGAIPEINTRGNWEKISDGDYALPGENYAITIDLDMNSGTLNLRN